MLAATFRSIGKVIPMPVVGYYLGTMPFTFLSNTLLAPESAMERALPLAKQLFAEKGVLKPWVFGTPCATLPMGFMPTINYQPLLGISQWVPRILLKWWTAGADISRILFYLTWVAVLHSIAGYMISISSTYTGPFTRKLQLAICLVWFFLYVYVGSTMPAFTQVPWISVSLSIRKVWSADASVGQHIVHPQKRKCRCSSSFSPPVGRIA